MLIGQERKKMFNPFIKAVESFQSETPFLKWFKFEQENMDISVVYDLTTVYRSK